MAAASSEAVFAVLSFASWSLDPVFHRILGRVSRLHEDFILSRLIEREREIKREIEREGGRKRERERMIESERENKREREREK